MNLSPDLSMESTAEIQIGGRFTASEAAERKKALSEALNQVDVLRIQLWGVVEMDLTGAITLIEVHRLAMVAGKRIQLVNPSTEVRQALTQLSRSLKEVKAGRW